MPQHADYTRYHEGLVDIYKKWWRFHEALLDSGLLAVACDSIAPSESFNLDRFLADAKPPASAVDAYGIALRRSLRTSWGLFLKEAEIETHDYFLQEVFRPFAPLEVTANPLSGVELPAEVRQHLPPSDENRVALLDKLAGLDRLYPKSTRSQNRNGDILQITLVGMMTGSEVLPQLVGIFGEDFHPVNAVKMAGVFIGSVTGVVSQLKNPHAGILVGDYPTGLNDQALHRAGLGKTEGCPAIPILIPLATRVKADFIKHVLEPYRQLSEEDKAKLSPEENRLLSGELWEGKKGEGKLFIPPKAPAPPRPRRGGKK